MKQARHSSAILAVALLAGTLAAQSKPLRMPAVGEVNRAREAIHKSHFRGALRIADQLEAVKSDPASTAAAALIRGMVAEEREGAWSSIPYYVTALTSSAAADQAVLAHEACENLGHAYFAEGRWDLMLELADRRLTERTVTDRDRALYLLLRGTALAEMRNRQGAIRALNDALPLATSERDLHLEGEIHRQLGLLYWRYDHDLKQAMAEYEKAIQVAKRGHDAMVLAETFNNSGNPFRSRSAAKNLPEALRRYNQGLVIARISSLHTSEAFLLKNIGEVYRQVGDSVNAERFLRQAVATADRSNVSEVRWMARLSLALLMSGTNSSAAERAFSECIDILEAQHSDVLMEDLRAGAFSEAITRNENPYDHYIAFLMAQGKAGEAFVVSERERARVFLDSLHLAHDAVARALPAGYSNVEHDVLGRIRELQAMLRTETLSDAQRNSTLLSLEREESQLEAERLRLASERPAIAHARYPKIWTAEELQSKLLAKDERLLSFYLGREQSFAWILSRDQLQTVRLPARDKIEREVRDALQDLKTPTSSGDAAMSTLSRTMKIDEIAGASAGSHLVVIPHGIFYAFPIEALIDSSGRRILERFAVSYAPSASSLAFIRSQRRESRSDLSLIAIADPIVRTETTSITRQFDLSRINLLSSLPKSSEEVHAVASALGGTSILLEKSRATRTALLASGIERAHILHFATHGFADEDHPERSGLLLTAERKEDDGLLQARDVYSLRLDADLVTLSACETAMGQNLSGEGMIGITRAFFFAGSRAVVSSLWDTEDSTTARLMAKFYGYIEDGEPIDVALQRAKLDLIRSGGATAQPFFWASFTASGNARSVIPLPRRSLWQRTRGESASWLAAVAIAMALVATFSWRRKRELARAATAES